MGWAGETSLENVHSAKGKPVFSLVMVKPKQHEKADSRAPEKPIVGDEVGINHQREPDGPWLPKFQPLAVGKGSPADCSENEAGQDVLWIEVQHRI